MAGSGTAHMREDEHRVLAVDDLVVEFPAGRRQQVHAVSNVSFDLTDGETLGLVGESGCGKSSAGRALMQLPPPTSGSVRFDGVEVTELKPEALRRTRTRMQMILQDPISSLNPRRKVKDLVAEGPSIWGNHGRAATRKKVAATLLAVGLDPATVWDRRPQELSGGQCQRVCIARALMLDPQVLICDEPVSSLDVSVQAQILNLLEDAKARYGLSLLFIAHDLAVVKNISDRVMVMYLGKVCEVAPAEALQHRAVHPYTRLLLDSIPDPDPRNAAERPEGQPEDRGEQTGELPSSLNPPSGCRFRTRCPLASERCVQEEPMLRRVGPGHYVACHNVAAPQPS